MSNIQNSNTGDIDDKVSRMINQALMYRRTGSKLIDNATRAVGITVEQSEYVATI